MIQLSKCRPSGLFAQGYSDRFKPPRHMLTFLVVYGCINCSLGKLLQFNLNMFGPVVKRISVLNPIEDTWFKTRCSGKVTVVHWKGVWLPNAKDLKFSCVVKDLAVRFHISKWLFKFGLLSLCNPYQIYWVGAESKELTFTLKNGMHQLKASVYDVCRIWVVGLAPAYIVHLPPD